MAKEGKSIPIYEDGDIGRDFVFIADVASALTLAGNSDTAKFIAGGQSLGPMLNLRLVQPDLLVDITAIDDLKRVEADKDTLFIGSCITHADIEDQRIPAVPGRYG